MNEGRLKNGDLAQKKSIEPRKKGKHEIGDSDIHRKQSEQRK